MSNKDPYLDFLNTDSLLFSSSTKPLGKDPLKFSDPLSFGLSDPLSFGSSDKKTNDKKDKESIFAYLEDKIAKWWKPDDIVFVDELPIGATGKVLKIDLREQYKDHLMK